jgi:hypothetical protein
LLQLGFWMAHAHGRSCRRDVICKGTRWGRPVRFYSTYIIYAVVQFTYADILARWLDCFNQRLDGVNPIDLISLRQSLSNMCRSPRVKLPDSEEYRMHANTTGFSKTNRLHHHDEGPVGIGEGRPVYGVRMSVPRTYIR